MSRGPILVTGATGFAGSHLVDLLSRDAAEVVACQRPGRPHPPSPPGVTRIDLDLLDAAAVRDAVARVRPSAVYHCAGAPHVGSSWRDTTATLAANVMTTHHLFEAVRAQSIACRVLVPGSAMVYRASDAALTEQSPIGPSSPYGVSKLAQEMLAAQAGRDEALDVVMTRSFNHIGPRQDPSFVASGIARQLASIEAGLADPVLLIGNVDARRDLTDVRDTVRAYRAIMERGGSGRVYNVCSGRAIAIRDLVSDLVTRVRLRVEIRVDAARLRPNDVPLVLGDARRLRDDTGWTPEIPLERTMTDLLDYWRQALARA